MTANCLFWIVWNLVLTLGGKNTPAWLSKEPDKAFHCVWSWLGEPWAPGLRSSDGETAQSGFSRADVCLGSLSLSIAPWVCFVPGPLVLSPVAL